MLKYRLT